MLADPSMGEVFPLLHALEQLLERYRDEGGAGLAYKGIGGARFGLILILLSFHLSSLL